MPRYMFTEELWSKLREILLQFSLYHKAGLRKTVESILFRMRTGVPWRDLPDPFGKWNSVYKVFNDWSKKGLWNWSIVFIDEFVNLRIVHKQQGANGGVHRPAALRVFPLSTQC